MPVVNINRNINYLSLAYWREKDAWDILNTIFAFIYYFIRLLLIELSIDRRDTKWQEAAKEYVLPIKCGLEHLRLAHVSTFFKITTYPFYNKIKKVWGI